MKYDEMLKKQPFIRKKPSDEEHRLQCACVRWFRYVYPSLKEVLFAIPNGGRRDVVTGARLKEEGATAGVSDLILLKSNSAYGALCVEMKTPKGNQSPAQKEWQNEVENTGNKYVVCRSFEEFKREITEYLRSK